MSGFALVSEEHSVALDVDLDVDLSPHQGSRNYRRTLQDFPFVVQTGRVRRVRSIGAAPRTTRTASSLEGAWPVSGPASPTCSTSPAQLMSPALPDAPVLPGEPWSTDPAGCGAAIALPVTRVNWSFDLAVTLFVSCK